MKTTLLAKYLLIIILFTGCLGPHKINKWVAEQYGGSLPPPSKKKSDVILITSPLVTGQTDISSTVSHTSNFLPLIVYWQSDYKNTCTLNPAIAFNTFTAEVVTYANRGLKQKLNGHTLQLSLDKVPTTFAIDDKGHMIWLLYAYSWDFVSVQPVTDPMVVSYKIMDGNTEIKNGTITIKNNDRPIRLKMFNSLKKCTWDYLDQYNDNITAMSKQLVDKLSAEM